MGLYLLKPSLIEAVQFTGEKSTELVEFINKEKIKPFNVTDEVLTILTLRGSELAKKGDYLVKYALPQKDVEEIQIIVVNEDIFNDNYIAVK